MQLARIVFAGALLFGAGCVPSEEGAPTIDQRVDPINLDDSIGHEHEADGYDNRASNYALDETVRMEGKTLQTDECKLELERLSEEQVGELQEILNTAIYASQFVLPMLTPEQLARIQDILASAIVPAPS